MAVSSAGLNSQSAIRLKTMLRVTATGNLNLFRDSIIDGTALTVTVPNGTVDGQRVSFTWEFGSTFTLSGQFQTTAGADTQITFAATDKPAPAMLVWKAATAKWSL